MALGIPLLQLGEKSRGIGLAQQINPRAGFLHDGRAETLEQAILWHGGVAEESANSYRAMSATERAALIRFLESL
jgi:CxxC motif-containing protein (DUF1111 family)